MGQILWVQPDSHNHTDRHQLRISVRRISPDGHIRRPYKNKPHYRQRASSTFIDLDLLPSELALSVLSNLNATDLCLASCVWQDLGQDDLLWQKLCHRTWPFCSAYRLGLPQGYTYRRLYLDLDEARLTFNADAFDGLQYLFKRQLLTDSDEDMLSFFTTAPNLDVNQRCRVLRSKPQILRRIVGTKQFKNCILPNALRSLFSEFPVPISDPNAMDFITFLVAEFCRRFVSCNEDLKLSADEVYLLCFSLIMLSVDLWSPNIKNKMSKREFIRNTRRVVQTTTDEFLGQLYDNVYIVGHVILDHLVGSPVLPLELPEIHY